jgi:hypothetical protein
MIVLFSIISNGKCRAADRFIWVYIDVGCSILLLGKIDAACI